MELMNNKKSSQPTWRKFTFLALIISLLALIATAILGIIKLLIQAQLYEVANPDGINRWLLISAGTIIIGLALYTVLEPEKASRFISRRQTRYGSNVFIMSLAFLGILIVGSVLAYQNPVLVADLTADQENTLAPELTEALKNLTEKITAVGFFSSQSNTDAADKLLSNIKGNSNGKFDYRFENPDLNPLAAREAGITGDGKILLTMGDRKEIAPFAGEQEILQAIIRLTNPNPRTVYFLSGHGEVGLEQGDVSFATAKQTLESKNYTVNSLSLIAEGKIPEDALAIVIGGPQKPVTEAEVELLKEYVSKGGSLVVLQDPYIFTEFGDAPDPLADYLDKDWGITLDQDVIIDISNSFGPQYAVSAIANQHPITQDINENLIIIMPQARSISLTSQPEGVIQTPLIQTKPPDQTSINSWGEVGLTAEGQVQYDDGADILGPLSMAVTGENTTTKGRVVVMGNSVFAAGQNFDANGNGNFFINSIDWAAEQEDLIQFTPRSTTQRTFVPPSQIQWLFILIGSICIIPGLVIVAGLSAWFARRRQG
jgi:gliding motility-associatede transport system auxiliary component